MTKVCVFNTDTSINMPRESSIFLLLFLPSTCLYIQTGTSRSLSCSHRLQTILYMPMNFDQTRKLVRYIHSFYFQSPLSPSSNRIIYLYRDFTITLSFISVIPGIDQPSDSWILEPATFEMPKKSIGPK